MSNEGLICWNCSKNTGLSGRISRADSCESCLADLRCCRGCRHFDPNRRFQCKESIETNVPNKEKSNFCDFFQARIAFKKQGGVSYQTDSKDERKKNFDDLFED
ncbi:MAG: hypothetical protein IID63_05205 [candidate division Zixibacteria bacterium]|nr:hypothetical protein [candidate division Zixibacteria bacterium]